MGPPTGTDPCAALAVAGCHLRGPWAGECACSPSCASAGDLAMLVPGAVDLWAAGQHASTTREQLAPLLAPFWRLPQRDVPCLLSQACPHVLHARLGLGS